MHYVLPEKTDHIGHELSIKKSNYFQKKFAFINEAYASLCG